MLDSLLRFAESNIRGNKIAAASKVRKGFVERRIRGRNLWNLGSVELAAVCTPIIRGTLNFHESLGFLDLNLRKLEYGRSRFPKI